MNAFSEDTIAAISTPVAAGGIGMVRISGPQALEVADRVFRSVSGKQVQQTEGYRGLYGRNLTLHNNGNQAAAKLTLPGYKLHLGRLAH